MPTFSYFIKGRVKTTDGHKYADSWPKYTPLSVHFFFLKYFFSFSDLCKNGKSRIISDACRERINERRTLERGGKKLFRSRSKKGAL